MGGWVRVGRGGDVIECVCAMWGEGGTGDPFVPPSLKRPNIRLALTNSLPALPFLNQPPRQDDPDAPLPAHHGPRVEGHGLWRVGG